MLSDQPCQSSKWTWQFVLFSTEQMKVNCPVLVAPCYARCPLYPSASNCSPPYLSLSVPEPSLFLQVLIGFHEQLYLSLSPLFPLLFFFSSSCRPALSVDQNGTLECASLSAIKETGLVNHAAAHSEGLSIRLLTKEGCMCVFEEGPQQGSEGEWRVRTDMERQWQKLGVFSFNSTPMAWREKMERVLSV